jgi:hypothetical protein
MKNAFKFLGKDSGEAAGNIAFGITMLFAAMAIVIGILGILTACCNKKCCTCTVTQKTNNLFYSIVYSYSCSQSYSSSSESSSLLLEVRKQ